MVLFLLLVHLIKLEEKRNLRIKAAKKLYMGTKLGVSSLDSHQDHKCSLLYKSGIFSFRQVLRCDRYRGKREVIWDIRTMDWKVIPCFPDFDVFNNCYNITQMHLKYLSLYGSTIS